jgi:acyl dehydratase
LAPTKHGDTVRLVQKVIEKKITSNPDRGIIKFDRRVLNQRDTVVMEMEATMMYRCRSDVKT